MVSYFNDDGTPEEAGMPTVEEAAPEVVEPAELEIVEPTPPVEFLEPLVVSPAPSVISEVGIVQARRKAGWGSVNIHGHEGEVTEGDIVEMTREAAEARPDFEVVDS